MLSSTYSDLKCHDQTKSSLAFWNFADRFNCIVGAGDWSLNSLGALPHSQCQLSQRISIGFTLMKRPQLTCCLIRMVTWWLAWLPFACVNICKYKQREPQTIPVPDVATQALRQCVISNDDHQNQNGFQKEGQTFKFWFWISEGAFLPFKLYVCGCWPMAAEATNLYGVKSFSIGGSLLVKNVCVQIQIQIVCDRFV